MYNTNPNYLFKEKNINTNSNFVNKFNMLNLQKLIVIEGNDGAGKTTLIENLKKYLIEKNNEVVIQKFNASEIIFPSIQLGKEKNYNVYVNTFLHLASIMDQLERIALPALETNKFVLCDRYVYSVLARGLSRGISKYQVNQLLSFFPIPQKVIYLDIDPKVALKRRKKPNAREITYWEAGLDITNDSNIDKSFLKFQQSVRSNFKYLLNDKNALTIDSSISEAEILKKAIEWLF